ncbi:MepB protein [Bacteroides sp. AN502(2024)]|uniref:MepB protein n=1 Tax=Bacteroides sp. AN502(2024) TaxID=3160599 RepID=UPI003511B9D5
MKKNFVKVMFFGALALSTVTYVGCKDYDDDVKSVQEQIDQIKSNNPVSVGDMQSAINAAKSALEGQLATLKTNLENKDSQITTLNQKVADLEDKLKNAADKSTVAQLTTDLTAAKNDLKALENLHQSDIDDLKRRIDGLDGLVNELNGLKDTFATKEELKNYVQTANLPGYISNEIAAALGEDGKIAAAINGAIQTQVLVEFGGMKEVAALAGEDGTVAKVIQGLYTAINDDENGILARLVELEDYKKELEQTASNNGFEGGVKDVVAEVKSLKGTLSGLYSSTEFGDAVKEIVKTELGIVKTDIETLKGDLEKLGVAINSMIQSVVYIPTTIDHSVDFYTLYAKKTSTSSSYVVAAKSADAKELQFRISPASAAMTLEDFNKNYEIKLNAEERNWTRAAEPFAVEVKNCEAGVLTVSLTTSSEKSHAISLNIASKKDAEGKEGLVPTNVNSDYIAVIQSSYYLKTAYYMVATEKAGEIIYDVPQPVDYSGVGTLTVAYTTTASGGTAFTKTLEELNVKNIFETTYSLDGTDSELFEISSKGSVSLKTSGLIASLDKTADVITKVTAPGFYLETSSENPKKLGTVTVTRTIDELTHTYDMEERDWTNEAAAAAEERVVLDVAKIYNNPAVNIRPSAYEGLNLVGTLPTTGIRLEKGNSNALTLIIPKNTAAGDYTATAKFEGDGYTLVVNVPVKIKPITLAKLARVSEMWSSDQTHTGFTPTRDSETAATAITSEFKLATIFSNFDAVKAAVLAKGGTFKITTNITENSITGVSYAENDAKFTFNKDTYTGKMTVDGESVPAVVKFAIKASYNGKVEDTIEGIVEVKDISGTWVAPTEKTLSLSDKSGEYNVSTGFAWNDLAGKTMWKNGAVVAGTGSNGFATSVTDPLVIYGLVAPTFAFKEAAASTYLSLDPSTGKVTFTAEGKSHHFYQAVTYTIEVKAVSKWGTIKNYEGKNTITVTIPAEE